MGVSAVRAKAQAKAQRRKIDNALTERIVWAFYVERQLTVSPGVIPDLSPENAANVRELRIKCRGNVREACRRIDRAFLDDAWVAAGVSLGRILDAPSELAA